MGRSPGSEMGKLRTRCRWIGLWRGRVTLAYKGADWARIAGKIPGGTFHPIAVVCRTRMQGRRP